MRILRKEWCASKNHVLRFVLVLLEIFEWDETSKELKYMQQHIFSGSCTKLKHGCRLHNRQSLTIKVKLDIVLIHHFTYISIPLALLVTVLETLPQSLQCII